MWFSYICPGLIFMCLVSHMVWWSLWNTNLHYTAAPSIRVRNSQLDATTEQMQSCTLNDLSWGPHLSTPTRKTKQTLASTIVTKVPAWIHQWAAELLKKRITSYSKTYWNSVEPGLSSAPHWHWLDPRHMESSSRTSRLHHTHTHVHNLCLLL